MDLKVLKSFITVCETGNITRASERLFISQPALTRQIKDLEEEVGSILFDRSTRALSLTESGHLFYAKAQEILSLVNSAKKELAEKGNFLRGTIKVGAVETSLMKFLAHKMKAFRETHPHVLFELYSADGDDLKRSLDENILDIAFLLEPVEIAKYVRTVLPGRERWGLVVKDNDTFKDKQFLTYKEVIQTPLILPRRYIVLEEISSWLHVPEKELTVSAYHNLPSNALDLVENDFGGLLCVEGSFENRQKCGMKFLPISPERYSGHVAVRRKNRQLSRPAELFWESLQDNE